LKEQLANLKIEKEQADLYYDSVNLELNRLNSKLDNYDIYKLKFDGYMLGLDQYNQQLSIKEEILKYAEKILEDKKSSDNNVNLAKSDIENIKYQTEKFINDYLTEASSTIAKIDESIIECKTNISGYSDTIALYSKSAPENEIEISALREEMILNAQNEIKNLKLSLSDLEKQLSEIELSIQNLVIKSPIDGNIEPYYAGNIGDYVGAGTKLASVVPLSNETIITLYVSSADISSVYIGQKVELRFTSLEYTDYGEFPAKITKVSADARQDQQSGVNYFVLEAELDKEKISPENFELIKVGMDCEAHVITGERSILNWALKKLNFIDE
jgi:multidrug resistance efflux pump